MLGESPGKAANDARGSVSLRQVQKRFADVHAVKGVSFDVRSGEFFSLLGPSGCGKSTMLRMVAGFNEPTWGDILIDGEQNYALFPHLSVESNVGFGLRRLGVEKRERKRRVGEALDLVQLEGYGRRKPWQLSGGQQQRVALARAIVNMPAVLLLDEPLGALDLKLRKQLQVELKQIQREVGITFVYVTHDQEEALTMSDRLAVMNEGEIEQIGTPEDIYERPKTPFVADFIGVSNLLEARVVGRDGDRLAARLADGTELTGEAAVPGLAIEADCFVMIRPEKLGLYQHHEPPDHCASPLRGVVAEKIYLGTTTQYVVVPTRGDQRLVVLEQNSDRATTSTLWQPDDEALVSWSAEHVLVMDGRAIPVRVERPVARTPAPSSRPT